MTTAWEHDVEAGRATGRRDGRRLPARLDLADSTHDHRDAPAHPARRIDIRVIGPLTIAPDGVPLNGRAIGAVKTRGLLELLLLARGAAVTKDELVHALWDGTRSLPADPIRTLEHYVCVLRAVLSTEECSGRDIILTGVNSYRLDRSLIRVDLDEFDGLLRHASAATGAERRMLLETAVAMAKSDLFDDSPDRGWAQAMRLQHRESVAWAHQQLADDAIAERDLHRVVWHAEQVLRCTPYSEHAFRVLMVTHVGLGSRELARLTHRRCVNTLWRHLRLDPTGHTTAVAAAIDSGATFTDLVALLAPSVAA